MSMSPRKEFLRALSRLLSENLCREDPKEGRTFFSPPRNIRRFEWQPNSKPVRFETQPSTLEEQLCPGLEATAPRVNQFLLPRG